MFGVTSESVIKHVHLNHIDIHGRDWVGGLVGSGHSVLIEYSKVSGQINGNNNVGSLVGGGYSQLNYSYSHANVNGHNYVGGLIGSYGIITESFSTGNVTGNEIVGGLVGANLYIHSSYATGNVAGNSRVGGLVGENEATPTGDYAVIVQSYATGKVTGDDLAGSLIGNRIANMLSNYWSSQSSGRDNWIGSNYKNKLLYLEKVSPSNGEEEWIGSESNRERLPVSITTSRTNLDRFYQTAEYGSADAPSIQLFGPPIVDVEDLAINQMQGQKAWIYMHKLDFVDTWQLTDGYPRLRWESPVDSVQAPDAAIIWVTNGSHQYERFQEIDFGEVNSDSTSYASITIQNKGNITLSGDVRLSGIDRTVFSISSGGGSFSLEPDSSITIELLFQPFESGNYQSIIDISHTALNVSDPYEIKVKGVGKVSTDSKISGEISEEILLKQNYPNPFNPYTVIEFYLPESGHITLEVYDITGRRIEVLVNEFKNAGVHSVIFDSSGLSSGVYRYIIQSEEFVRTRMMTFIK